MAAKVKRNATPSKVAKVKKFKKRHKVNRGDIVHFHSVYQNVTGSIGEVLGYWDRNTVLVRTFGGADNDFPPIILSVDPRQWDENHTNKGHYYTYIKRVVHRATPLKKRHKERKVDVLESHEDLIRALTGERQIETKGVVMAFNNAQAVVDTAVQERDGQPDPAEAPELDVETPATTLP